MTKFVSFLFGAFMLIVSTQVMAIDPPTKSKKTAAIESFGFEIPSSTYRDAIFQSTDNSKVYIDFNDIPVNLKCIQVLDGAGNVLLKRSVYELPVNSLFEIDLTTFTAPNLVLEIQTFTDSRFILLGAKR